jgi:hypothetical protein
MGAGQPQVLAQQLDQKRARIDIRADGFAIHGVGNGRHMRLLGFPKTLFLRTARGRLSLAKAKNTPIWRVSDFWNQN